MTDACHAIFVTKEADAYSTRAEQCRSYFFSFFFFLITPVDGAKILLKLTTLPHIMLRGSVRINAVLALFPDGKEQKQFLFWASSFPIGQFI